MDEDIDLTFKPKGPPRYDPVLLKKEILGQMKRIYTTDDKELGIQVMNFAIARGFILKRAHKNYLKSDKAWNVLFQCSEGKGHRYKN